MRAQRAALSLFSFSAKHKIPTALVQPSASLSWRATTCQALLQSQRYTDVHLDLCQFGHKMRRPIRVLLANVEKNFAAVATVSILFALVLEQVTAKQKMSSRANYQLSFVTLWCAH